MSEVMPYKEENMSHYEGKEEEGQISITCRLQDTNNFFGTAQNKRPPKLGQIGRSKRGERQQLVYCMHICARVRVCAWACVQKYIE